MVKSIKKEGARKHTNANVLPKILIRFHTGGIYKQDVRCGKKNCKCARGETHTAYYFFYRLQGKLTKEYIPKAQLAEARALVDERVERRDCIRDTLKAGKEYCKQLRAQDWMNREMGIVERFDGRFPRRVGELIERKYPEHVEAWRKEEREALDQESVD